MTHLAKTSYPHLLILFSNCHP